ncbi:hypothetical protein BKN38_01250 [Helicobacter sp. CLO-3]|nr:hypothetical protein BA723_00055 [Helicobacter sp. CLO-3]OHU85193.1 hypothetical protein BKN38_01250 [Helicobacter sp. CLO-3]
MRAKKLRPKAYLMLLCIYSLFLYSLFLSFAFIFYFYTFCYNPLAKYTPKPRENNEKQRF